MTLNKKQKKQIEVEKQRITQLRQRLSGAREQMDDPKEVTRLEQDIAECNARILKIQQTDAS